MSRVEASLHSLKADPSARADDQDLRHGAMLPVRTRLAHDHVQCGHSHRKMGALLERQKELAAGVPARAGLL
jgi:hypothetical protein